MNKFRICYTAQNGEKTVIYDDPRFHITLDGTILENYGTEGKPVWEELFDCENPPILQRFTGAYGVVDFNHVYEGDLVKTPYSEDIGEVYFDDQTLAFRVKLGTKLHPIVVYRTPPDKPEQGQFVSIVHTVVGNIFENKIEDL